MRILAEVEHVVVMGMTAHAHGYELDQRGSQSATCALGGPGERRGDGIRIGAVDGDGRNAVAEGFVGEHANG